MILRVHANLPVRALLPALAVLAGALPASAAELKLLRTVGADEEEILLYRPEQIAFTPGGEAYVVNGGDCQVLHFDADWNLLNSFGKCGQGPGEFERATGLILRAGAVWVFELGRATLFDPAGKYLETRRSQQQMKSPVVAGDRILCLLDGGDRALGRLDDQLALVEKLGPGCPADDFFQRFKDCGMMHLILHPDYLCLLINAFDGRLHAVGADGEVARTVSLMGEEGYSSMSQEDDSLSMSLSLVLGIGFVDTAGRLWSLPFPQEEGEDEDALQVVAVRDRKFEPLVEFTLPEGVNGYRLVQSPRGELVLVDANQSLIHVLEFPELPDRN